MAHWSKDETKRSLVSAKISAKLSGRTTNPAGCFKKGHLVPESWRETIRRANKGIRHSPQTEFKPGLPRYEKRRFSDEAAIRCFQERRYNCAKIASLFGVSKTSVQRRLRGLGYDISRNEGRFVEGRKARLRHGFYDVLRAFKEAHKKCEVCDWDVCLETHHIIPIFAGGTNSPDNLARLCPNHHRMADRGLLKIRKESGILVCEDSVKQMRGD